MVFAIRHISTRHILYDFVSSKVDSMSWTCSISWISVLFPVSSLHGSTHLLRQ